MLLIGETAIIGTDDGQITAVDVGTGEPRWSVDVGDHVLASMAGTEDLVFASVQPETRDTASLVALRVQDGSEAWRYQPAATVIDLGSPSVLADRVFVVGSDASLRALDTSDGSERWASGLYTRTSGSPPTVGSDGVFVTDMTGTVYGFDADSGLQRWRFATNVQAIGAPIFIPDAILQPMSDGTIVAIDTATGHQIWHLSVADSAIIGLAATSELVVATHTGVSPGFVAMHTDPTASTMEDIASPTTADPTKLVLAWMVAALPIILILMLLGRVLGRRMGSPELGSGADDIVDPWEADLEDQP